MPLYDVIASDPRTGEAREIAVDAADLGEAARRAFSLGRLGGEWPDAAELEIVIRRRPPEPPVDVRTVERVLEAMSVVRDAERSIPAAGLAVAISQRIERERLA